MRIAVFCPTVSGFGGMEAAITNLIHGFDATGDECRLFLLGGSVNEEWLRQLPHTAIGSPKDPKVLRLAKYALRPAMELSRWRPDAVIAADVTTLQMARLARRLTGNRKMVIASWIHFPVAKLRMKERLGLADCHLAISNGIATDIKAMLPASSARVFTIYNAIHMESRAAIPRPLVPQFLYVGRLTWDDQKRVNDLLHALAGLRGAFTAKIIGSAPDSHREDGLRLRKLARELNLDSRVEWLGWQAEPWKAAGAGTVLVMTSSYEGFGMVLVEAMARGLPCISSDCESGPAEIIQPGRNGWLYPVGDIETLTALMQRTIDEPSCLPPADEVQASVARFSPEAVALRARQALELTLREA
ncbi:glycosyltransferase [Acidipila rosea]|uniref:UDP-D-galactose:(Glucosyl)LPS alpha-1,6-D-galactosyltransferase n=1 Tax=Acidipila rosea TaxID=768535 RepID=A0A4R1L6I6_9BACT|nr:glycosyltransferase [Acidipila rosea]TCK73754.1 UDP-D-galactose:(glucosyl)LPS alpha-1,6-D-galactosyltransferase [Acidipila rosea]